jgi:glycosyltransferase 2 family protein
MKLKRLLPLAGLILLFIIIFNLNFEKIFRVFVNINPIYAFLSFLIIVPLLLLVNVEWQLLLKKQKINVSFWYSLKNFFIGYFYGFITPGGFGAYTRALYLAEESSTPLPKCFSNIIIFNTVEFFAMLITGAIGALILSSIYPYLFVIILLVFIITFIVYLFFFKSHKSRFLFKKIVRSRIFFGLKDRLESSIDTFHEDLPGFKDVLAPLGLSIAGWFLKYFMLFFIAKLFDINIEFVFFIAIMAVADIIAAIPISYYGIGTRDLTLIYLFTNFRFINGKIIPGEAVISAEQVISFSLFCIVIIWIVPSIIGSFVTFYESKKLFSFKLDKNTDSRFEQYMKRFPELYIYLAGIVKKNISEDIKKPVIVDLGVGPGLLSKEINELVPNAHIIGIDPSEEMLKISKKNASIETKRGIAEKIPLTDSSVDCVVSRFNLTYWTNPKTGFSEIYRILKPDGIFVIEALNKDFSSFKLFLIRINMVFKGSGFDIAKYHIDAYKTAYSIDSVKKLFRDSGFEIIYSEGEKKDWKFIFIGKK